MTDELRSLCEALIEGRLTEEERQRLERLVVASPEARRLYVEYLHQHASLHWSAGGLPAAPPPKRVMPSRWRPRRMLAMAGLAAAGLLIVGGWLMLQFSRTQPPVAVATLTSGKACKWDGGTLPTEVGARLGVGKLRLAEGLAKLVFDSGAELTLEAPADLEVVSASKCVLHSGRLVAKVPPQAIGFVVETPTTIMKDLGTEFGVNVQGQDTTDVQVFDGRVDVQHRASGRMEQMKTGKNLRFGAETVDEFDPLKDPPPTAGGRPPEATHRVVHVSTAMGRGKDAYVQPLFPSQNMSDVLLLVKNTVAERSDYDRKAYVGLDLTPVAGMQVLEAQLSLTFTPTGMGFASEVPDATFAVYGLTDESLDGWDDKTLRWPNAPANRAGGAALDADKVTLLGKFEIVQGALSGTRTVTGQALVDFLNRDTNGMTTFIVVRETKGSGRTDLVHGFAGRNHPTLPPTTLKLTVAPKPR